MKGEGAEGAALPMLAIIEPYFLAHAFAAFSRGWPPPVLRRVLGLMILHLKHVGALLSASGYTIVQHTGPVALYAHRHSA
jgi:hypothetical protein